VLLMVALLSRFLSSSLYSFGSALCFFSLLIPLPPSSTLFPYTTLFRSFRCLTHSRPRSRAGAGVHAVGRQPPPHRRSGTSTRGLECLRPSADSLAPGRLRPDGAATFPQRAACRTGAGRRCLGGRTWRPRGTGTAGDTRRPDGAHRTGG